MDHSKRKNGVGGKGGVYLLEIRKANEEANSQRENNKSPATGFMIGMVMQLRKLQEMDPDLLTRDPSPLFIYIIAHHCLFWLWEFYSLFSNISY